MTKPILCMDFDGVIHSYTSGWKGADVIPDPPVPGAIKFLEEAVEHFEVHIYSSRSGQAGGINAMQDWLMKHTDKRSDLHVMIQWPIFKPPAMVTIDDRAITFDGSFDGLLEQAKNFKPWNKR